MYIHNMFFKEREQLCALLDRDKRYKELGTVHMQFDVETVEAIQDSDSPTEKLLVLWSLQNHTVLELFGLLSQMKHYQAMAIIKNLVDQKYHVLMKRVEPTLAEMIAQMRAEQSEETLDEPQVVDQKLLNPVAEFAGVLPQIPYEELQESTDNWDSGAILGRGGFGTVFRGIWKCTKVAIKRIEQRKDNPEALSEQIKQSRTELYCLNAYRHDNILPLYGYSIGGPQPCLVYQYMSGACLARRLHVRNPDLVLNWATRLDIAIGTARGLQYLHTIGEKPLIHGDIKPANILLDPNDVPRIGDFGLAREGPHSDYTHIEVSKVFGTWPYLPYELLVGKQFSTKVDTYSFGVVLFEIATALKVHSKERQNKCLRDHVVNYEGDITELKDERAPAEDDDYFKGLIDIGKMCVSEKAKDRPEMVSVLIRLEAIV